MSIVYNLSLTDSVTHSMCLNSHAILILPSWTDDNDFGTLLRMITSRCQIEVQVSDHFIIVISYVAMSKYFLTALILRRLNRETISSCCNNWREISKLMFEIVSAVYDGKVQITRLTRKAITHGRTRYIPAWWMNV